MSEAKSQDPKSEGRNPKEIRRAAIDLPRCSGSDWETRLLASSLRRDRSCVFAWKRLKQIRNPKSELQGTRFRIQDPSHRRYRSQTVPPRKLIFGIRISDLGLRISAFTLP